MTSKTTTLIRKDSRLDRFPDFPPREDMQNTKHLHLRSVLTTLLFHFANRARALVHGEVPVAPTLDPWGDYRIPDLIVAFGCDLDLVNEQRGYAIDRQGKAPDWVLEVASPTTGVVDYTTKRRDYERYGIAEYWRFDPSGGEFHDAALAGDRLVDGRYEPIVIETLGDGNLRGYSEALGLYVCWEDGELRFYDPVAEDYLPGHEEERAGRQEAELRAGRERAGRQEAEIRAGRERAGRQEAELRAGRERAGRQEAESRVAELEAELRRLRGE